MFVRQSKVEGYRSRAVYKLIEINEKFKVLENGISLVDLGSAPGSWSQYIGDFTANKAQKKIKDYFKSKIDVVLSDMAQNTTGNKNLDVISITELCKEAMFFAKNILKDNGSFVCKIFIGSTFKEIMRESKLVFKEIKVFKPSSSKKNSKESFIVCKFLR